MKYTSYAFISRQTTDKARDWQQRLEAHLQANHPHLVVRPASEADLVLVLGGDGTLIEAMCSPRKSLGHFLAFHTGNHGFLLSVREESRFLDTLEATLTGAMTFFPVPIITIRHRSGKQKSTYRAINDLVIEQTMTWITMRVETVNERGAVFVKEVRGAGLSICSPIGSTTPLAVHVHAPRMDAGLRVFYVKGTNDSRPPTAGFILSAIDQKLRVTITDIEPNFGVPDTHKRPPDVYADGIHVGTIAIGDVIELGYTSEPAILLRSSDDTHWDRVGTLLS